jgi:hypothetical protein
MNKQIGNLKLNKEREPHLLMKGRGGRYKNNCFFTLAFHFLLELLLSLMLFSLTGTLSSPPLGFANSLTLLCGYSFSHSKRFRDSKRVLANLA